MVRCGWDDGYFVGPEQDVFKALEVFSRDVNTKAGLVLQVTKSEVYSASGVMPTEAPTGFVKAGVEVQDQFQQGFLCYGVPIGSEPYVTSMLDSKIDELEGEVEKICQTLDTSRQSMWAMLVSSTCQKLDYWLTLVYPSQMKEAASRMDKLVLRVVQKILGSEIPLRGGQEDWNTSINDPIESLKDRSFQEWVLRLPVRLGGLGIRSTLETRHAAFIGGVEQALPHFTNREGVCDQLNPFIGDFTGSKDTRWGRLINSGCRTGSEFAESWDIIKEEVSESHRYLEKSMDLSPMNISAQGAGDGREDGTTRKIVPT